MGWFKSHWDTMKSLKSSKLGNHLWSKTKNFSRGTMSYVENHNRNRGFSLWKKLGELFIPRGLQERVSSEHRKLSVFVCCEFKSFTFSVNTFFYERLADLKLFFSYELISDTTELLKAERNSHSLIQNCGIIFFSCSLLHVELQKMTSTLKN